MKKNISSFFILIALLTTQDLAANTGTRGGGDAVVCYSGSEIKTVELLDYFEATQMGLTLDLGPDSLSYQEKIKIIVDRWKQFDPMLTDYFRPELLNFSDNAAFLNRSYLKDIDDSQEILSPGNECRLRQMAISRLEPLVPGEKKFLIDQQLWSLLSNTQKAGLVLHEVLWSFYKKNNNELKESSLIRRFNAILSSSLMNQSTAEQYVQVIRQLWPSIDPKSYTFESAEFPAPSIRFSGVIYIINAGLKIENGKVLRGSTPEVVSYVVGNNTYDFGRNSFQPVSAIEFYESGAVRKGRLSKSIDILLPQGQRLVLPDIFSTVEFNESGVLKKVTASSWIDGITYWGKHVEESKNPPSLTWNGARFPISEIVFFENGSIQSIKLFTDRYHSSYSFVWKANRYEIKYDLSYGEMFYRDAEIEFDKAGNIVQMSQIIKK